MTDADNRPAVVGQVERPVRPAAEARWYCLSRIGVAMLCSSEADALAEAKVQDRDYPRSGPHRAAILGDTTEAQREIDRLREALTELRDRIKEHPAYADLTMEEDIEEGGDTAEFSYLARVADAALGA